MAKPFSLIKDMVSLVVDQDYTAAPIIQSFEKSFIGETPAGFKFRYTIYGNLEICDRDQFKEHRMLEPERQNSVIDEFHKQITAHIEQTNSFWTISWTNYRGQLEPMAFLSRVITKDGKQRIETDLNCVEPKRAIEKSSAFIRNGCKVILSLIITDLTDAKLNRENFNMLTPAVLEAIEGGDTYRAVNEATVVATMKKRLQLRDELQRRQTNQTHQTSMLTVATRLAGNNVEIRWEFSSECRNAGWCLNGFRKEGNFAPDKWSETDNGVFIIDSYRDGGAVEHLEDGKTYFYTLFLNSPKKKASSIRFSLRIPTAAERNEAERMLASLNQGGTQKLKEANPKQEQINNAVEEALGDLGLYMELDEAIDGVENKLRARIESKGYSSEERRDKIDRLESIIEIIRLNHLHSRI